MPAEAAADAPALVIAKFEKALHDRSAFSCGHDPIDHFLKSSLSDHVKAGMVTAYVVTEEGAREVLGYYTLGAMAVRAGLGPKKWAKTRVPDVPVIYIRAVAVRTDRQGVGLGKALVVDAIRRCVEIAEAMGAAAIVLDVLRDDKFERRWRFYEELGFVSLGDPENPDRVYMSMADARASLG